ncbi:hypothetical protein [Jidongwangia harbinensis]|uniref:hypothetical protein n=1 Tax=Jidongwangia harbinensis TaxID=2878561 RepID=UPI001CD9A10A|nr:hypothetical protein [Jidongwangia harbinensis]MCA2211962.1 hypothetical protein [Jidongwangia harbinensis]
MNLSEVMVAATVTLGVVGTSYAAFNTDALTDRAQTVAGVATCRAVDQAVLAYVAAHDAPPKRIADLRPYLRGDISGYRLVQGRAAGPGCPAAG